MDEAEILIAPGGCLRRTGAAESAELQQQLAIGMAISALLGGDLVVIRDWLPGLHWRLQVSQCFADSLPTLTVGAIWERVEPHLKCWLNRPADAEVLSLADQWGECMLLPSVYHWPADSVAFTVQCDWGSWLNRQEA